MVRQREAAARSVCAASSVAPRLGRNGRVITSVVVTYQVRPQAVAEHVRLIEAVFEQLRTERPAGVLDYQVRCLDDGVSFVHVSTADTPDGSNPLPDLAAFQAFGRDSSARVATTPVPRPATVIGYYYAAAELPEMP
jgi:D-alanyl-D-alanine carboxypeptidase